MAETLFDVVVRRVYHEQGVAAELGRPGWRKCHSIVCGTPSHLSQQ
jgi:hypothetical protein